MSARPCLSVVMPCFNERATVLAGRRPGARLAVDRRGDRRRRRVDRRHAASSSPTLDDRRRPASCCTSATRARARRCARGFAAGDRRRRHRPGRRPRVRPGRVRRRCSSRSIDGQADVVFGSRFLGGRPHRVLYFWHSLGNRVLTTAVEHVHQPEPDRHGDVLQGVPPRGVQALDLEEDRFGFEPEITAKVARGRLADLRGRRSPTPGAPTTRARRSAGATAAGARLHRALLPGRRAPAPVAGSTRQPVGPPAGRRSAVTNPHRVTSSIDSTTIRPDIFDVPKRRSVNTIGVSMTRRPLAHEPPDQLGQEGVALGGRRLRLDRPQRRWRGRRGSRTCSRAPAGRARTTCSGCPSATAARRCSGQSTVAPPGTYREPITASAPASISASRSASTAGSWEKSTSIDTTTS